MKHCIKGTRFPLAGTAIAACLAIGSATAAGPVMYSSVPDALPGNVASLGFEATSASEFGDRVKFVAGTGGVVRSVTVVMSSWGCESGSWNVGDCVTTPGATFSHPITLNLYANGAPTPGTQISSITQTFVIPYRPSASPACGDGRWLNVDDNTCYNGFATEVTFEFPSPGVAVPDTVVWGVAYNTTHRGYSPIGEGAACYSEPGGCGYDSLNVGAQTLALIGTDVDPQGVYWNTSFAPFYCDGGTSGVSIFRLDTAPLPCGWEDNRPMATFIGGSAKDCKKGGWQLFTDPPFKNQGACVSYFQPVGK